MTTLTYNVSRQQAASRLWVSTRTVDRYVKWGKLSYKKVANKVILADEEIVDLQKEFDLLHQQDHVQTEVVNQRSIPMNKLKKDSLSAQSTWVLAWWAVQEFADILTKKDKTIEEKNKLIFALQHKLGELETKMSHMVALPDYSKQKEELTATINTLEQEVKKEKMRNAVYVWLILVCAIVLLTFVFMV